MTSYADDITLLTLVRLVDVKQLAIAHQKFSLALFTSDTNQSWFQPQVRIGNEVAPLNRTPKIMGITLDTHFFFGPYDRDCVEQASRALNVMKALGGSSSGFMNETLVVTYKAIKRLILKYATAIWFTQVSLTHLDKLQVI